MNTTMPAAATPKNCTFYTHRAKPQLKVVIMLLTLISFYYHGCYLIVSCSLLNGAVVSANRNYDRDRVVFQTQSHRGSKWNPHRHDNQREHRHLDDKDDHHYSHQQHAQANDIFTKLTHSQGRIDEHNNNVLADSKGNSVARDGDKFHTIAEFIHGKSSSTTGAGDTNSRGESASSSKPQLNPKRYAFSAPGIETEKSADVSCKDESGNNVEWFIAYKIPQISTSQDPLVVHGSKYYFLTANQTSWKESAYPINSNQSILATTMQVLWENDSTSQIARLAYNDQPPSEPAVVMNGHTKGLIWTTMDEGVWLQHSCPHFADLTSKDFASSYPPGGLINGQMFMCMSLQNTTSVDLIGGVLQYTKPFIYNYSIPATLESRIPTLMKVAEKNATIRTAPWFNTYQLQAGSLSLKVYAKGPKFRREMYSSWIAPDYETGLDVQSWLNGAHPYMSNCTSSEHPVFNILMKNVSSQDFSNTDDHSKWAVSANKDKPVVCVGDLNRMKPQKTRGGVAICVTDQHIWSAFKSLVKEVQPCNSTSLKHFSNRISKTKMKTWRKHA